MKKILFSLAVLCAVLGLCAQPPEKPSRWSIALTAGPAIPVGSFAYIHNDHATGKPVDIGGISELSGAYRIWRFFSAAVAVNGQLNHGNGIPANLVQTWSYNNWQVPHSIVLANYWQITRILAGGIFTLPLTKHSGPALVMKTLAGIQKTRTPDFSYPDPYVVPAHSGTLYVPGQNLSSTFSYQLDAGIKWSFGTRWAFLAYTGYNGSKSSIYPNLIYFPPAETVPGSAPGIMTTYQKTKLPTGTFYYRAGVEVNL